MEEDRSKEEFEKWVDTCPSRDLQNGISGISWMTFESSKSFKEWLKKIPIFKKEKCITNKAD